VLLELALALPQPRIAPLSSAPDDLVHVELKRHLGGYIRVGLADRLRALLFAPHVLARPAKELAPPRRRAQRLGQLITARLAERFVLGLVDRLDLGDDLARDLLESMVDLRAGVARDPGAVDRHHPGLDQPRPITQLQHVGEQLAQRALVAADEPRDRRVIGH
jgi:hypothetical protein